MKKLLIFSILCVSIFGLLWYLKRNVGDLRPVLLPAMKQASKTSAIVKRGKPLDFDLHIASGFQIGIFAEHLSGVRDLLFSPKGTLVASMTSAGTVIALPDANHDGIADEVVTLLSGLRRPHGIAFYHGKLYLAEETEVSRYSWDEQIVGGKDTVTTRREKQLFSLPPGGRHFTRSIAFNKDGTMYISLGSTCDVCIEHDPFLASVIVSDAEGKAPKLFAKGLRNAPFITINPTTNELWGTEMGRDFLGDVTPPDEIDIIHSGKDYGWPYCYGDKVYDKNFNKKSATYCSTTESPTYQMHAHVAPLGLAFITSPQFPKEWQGDLLVAYHGSWNSSTPVGYKVVRLNVEGNTISGEEDFLSGFLQGGAAPILSGSAVARPVDVEFDQEGNLYVSDDKAGHVFIVSKK